MRNIRKLKNWIKKLPPLAISIMAVIYWVIHPSKKKAVILPRSPFWVIYSDGKKKWFIPEFTGGEVFGSIEHRLLKKYTLEGFIEIEEGGVVFDIGAFIGGFSSNAAEKAGKVVSIEPDPFNYFCLKKNTGEYENVNPVRKLVWKSNNEITLNLGTDPTDHSTLNVDGLKQYSRR
ncbi:hypothetical protein AKJ52_00675 [candidate division MSBL1 archaeon SCGC-AAA382C18]|uniref:SAM-dependent methyltransferase TRM5/TYW2-type domain-containing protein n=1 Tax=candidate division MSBL1 archaeon SCGC-AAA382C18 TaxID=1698281 RepID=A0A133VLD5_9EURY|nr:hypothetical protein AKJ52_00675 [candidate division MSBL1 archaeon SCGC-AAA382C18]